MVLANQGSALGLSPGDEADLVTVTTPTGAKFSVARKVAPQFQGFLNELTGGGYGINPQTSGGYNNRTIAGTHTPSQHAYGNAIDLNWDINPRGGTPAGNLPANVRDLANKYGITWGGDFSNPDPMHFEVSRLIGDGGAPANAPTGGNAPQTGKPMDIGTALASQAVSGANPVPGALDLGPLPSESKKALAQALMANAFQRSGNLGGGWLGPLSALAQIYAGSKIAGNYEQQANDRQKKLAQALMGAQGNDELTRTLLASGDPDLIKAAVTNRLGSAQRGLTPVPMYDDQGNLVYGTVGHTGDWTPLQTPKGGTFKAAPKATSRIIGNERITTDAYGNVINREPIDLQAAQREKEAGKLQAAAQNAYPEVERQTNQLLKTIDYLDTNPSRKAFTGFSGATTALTPDLLRYTETRDYQGYLNQIKGGTFLAAYNALKGAGAISDAEGKKAEAALTRLQTVGPSEAGYQAALDDARETFKEILANAKKRASGEAFKSSAPAAAAAPLASATEAPAASSPAPAAPAASTAPPSSADAIAQARDAIAKGAPRDAVIQRLQGLGIDTSGL